MECAMVVWGVLGGDIIVKVKEDMTGKVFGELVVLRQTDDYVSPKGLTYARWICRCSCGNIITLRGDSLRRRKLKTCGCKGSENQFHTHGDASRNNKNRLYIIWDNMIQRCTNPNRPDYKHYGGRGIIVCDDWRRYEVFNEWSLTHGYDDDLTLDRKDVNGNYCPENCRWVSFKVQSNNRRNNHYLTCDGITMSMQDWATRLNVPYATLRSRVNSLHWSDEQAIKTPFQTHLA